MRVNPAGRHEPALRVGPAFQVLNARNINSSGEKNDEE
jgi:hypothetical protein